MADVTEMPAMPADAGAARAGGDGTTTAGERVTEGKASPSDPSAVTGRVGGEAMGDAGGPGTAGTGDQDNATGDANGKHATPTVTYKEGTKDHTQVGASPTPSTTVDGKTVVLSEIFFDPENPEEEDDDEEMDEGDRELGEQLVDVGGDAAAAAKPGGDSGTPGVRLRSVRQSAHITQEELSGCFHLPSEAACRKLGIGLTVLKRQCRKYGIKRWPFRKMKSLDRLITNVQAGISPGDQNRVLVKSVEELEEQKQRMQECHELDLDENTKRLQQAYSKANHKARRMAHQTDMGGVGGLLALSGGGRSERLARRAASKASQPRREEHHRGFRGGQSTSRTSTRRRCDDSRVASRERGVAGADGGCRGRSSCGDDAEIWRRRRQRREFRLTHAGADFESPRRTRRGLASISE